MARRPEPRVRRRDQLLGARRDGPGAGGAAGGRRRGDDAGPGRRDARARTSPTRRSAAGSSRRCSRSSGSKRACPASSCSARGGRSSSGSPRADPSSSCSRTSITRTRGCSTSSTALVDWSRSSPILRRHPRPPGAPRAPPRLGRGQAQLHVAPPGTALGAGDARAARGARPGLPEAAVRPIVARADGIPLYAVETVRMLLADGRLEERDGAYVPVGDIRELAVPETLTALIASRLDGLEPADHALVSDAVRPGAVVHASPAWPPCRGRAEAELEPRLRAPGPPRDPLDRRRPTLARAGPVPLRPGAHPRGCLPHAGPAGAQGAPPRRGPVPRGALGRTSSPVPSRATTSRPRRTPARAPSADALAGQARIALQGAAQRAAALGSHDQAVGYLRAGARRSRRTRCSRPSSCRDWARSAEHAGRYELAETSLRRAADLARGTGDRPRAAAAIAAAGQGADRRAPDRGGARPAGAGRDGVRRPRLRPWVRCPPLAAGAGALLHRQLEAGRRGGGARPRDRRARRPHRAARRHPRHEGIGARQHRPGPRRDRGDPDRGRGRPRPRTHRDPPPRAPQPVGLRGLRGRSRCEHGSERRSCWSWLAASATATPRSTPSRRSAGRRPCSTIEPDRAIASWTDLLAEDLEPSDEAPILSRPPDPANVARGSIDRPPRPARQARRDAERPGLPWPAAGHPRLERPNGGPARRGTAPLGDTDHPVPGTGHLPALLVRAGRVVERGCGGRDRLGRVPGRNRHPPAGDGPAATIPAMPVSPACGESWPKSSAGYRHVLDGWRQLGHTYEEAFTAIDMAMILGPDSEEVRQAADRARDIFERLGATPFLERLEASMSRPSRPCRGSAGGDLRRGRARLVRSRTPARRRRRPPRPARRRAAGPSPSAPRSRGRGSARAAGRCRGAPRGARPRRRSSGRRPRPAGRPRRSPRPRRATPPPRPGPGRRPAPGRPTDRRSRRATCAGATAMPRVRALVALAAGQRIDPRLQRLVGRQREVEALADAVRVEAEERAVGVDQRAAGRARARAARCARPSPRSGGRRGRGTRAPRTTRSRTRRGPRRSGWPRPRRRRCRSWPRRRTSASGGAPAVSTSTTARSPSQSTALTVPRSVRPPANRTVTSGPRRLWALVRTRPSAITTPEPRWREPIPTTDGPTAVATAATASWSSVRTDMGAGASLVRAGVGSNL